MSQDLAIEVERFRSARVDRSNERTDENRADYTSPLCLIGGCFGGCWFSTFLHFVATDCKSHETHMCLIDRHLCR